MRAWEFMTEGRGAKPKITLRHLNKIKRQQQSRDASLQNRVERTRAMYANTNWQKEQLEIERMRLELEQLKAETEATKAEARATNAEAISELARSGSEAKDHDAERVQNMAMAEINRQQKS